jgi:hypothetical protein
VVTILFAIAFYSVFSAANLPNKEKKRLELVQTDKAVVLITTFIAF